MSTGSRRCTLIICMLGNYYALKSAFFSSKLAFSKISFRNLKKVQNSLDSDKDHILLLGLIWAQTVWKGYQWMTLAGKVSAIDLRSINDQGSRCIIITPGRRQSKTSILSSNIDQKSL